MSKELPISAHELRARAFYKITKLFNACFIKNCHVFLTDQKLLHHFLNKSEKI